MANVVGVPGNTETSTDILLGYDIQTCFPSHKEYVQEYIINVVVVWITLHHTSSNYINGMYTVSPRTP